MTVKESSNFHAVLVTKWGRDASGESADWMAYTNEGIVSFPTQQDYHYGLCQALTDFKPVYGFWWQCAHTAGTPTS